MAVEVDNDYHAAKVSTEAAVSALERGQRVNIFFKGDDEPISVVQVKFERFVIVANVPGGRTFYIPHSSLAAIAIDQA
jgi:hypothetical protein